MKKLITTFGGFLLIVAFGRPAMAVPVLGGQLFYSGGAVTVESLAVTSGYVSELGLYDASFVRLLNIMNDEPPGVVVSFNPGTAYGFVAGQELIFGILVVSDLGREYFMGPAARNPDGIFHAIRDDLGGGIINVGFEDLFGGGDLDYDDNRFKFSQGVASAPVPEPATLGMLWLGLLSLVRLSKNRHSR